jgi:hypothetical protein
MAGLLDMLLGAQANTGAGSQSATQNGPDMSMMQAASPWGNGTNFNTGTPANLLFTSGQQQAQQPSSFMQLLQSLMGVKQPSTPPGEQPGDPNFTNLPYQPSPEQIARMQQLTATFPQSRNVVDVRGSRRLIRRQVCHFNKWAGGCKVRCRLIRIGHDQTQAHSSVMDQDNEIYADFLLVRVRSGGTACAWRSAAG